MQRQADRAQQQGPMVQQEGGVRLRRGHHGQWHCLRPQARIRHQEVQAREHPHYQSEGRPLLAEQRQLPLRHQHLERTAHVREQAHQRHQEAPHFHPRVHSQQALQRPCQCSHCRLGEPGPGAGRDRDHLGHPLHSARERHQNSLLYLHLLRHPHAPHAQERLHLRLLQRRAQGHQPGQLDQGERGQRNGLGHWRPFPRHQGSSGVRGEQQGAQRGGLRDPGTQPGQAGLLLPVHDRQRLPHRLRLYPNGGSCARPGLLHRLRRASEHANQEQGRPPVYLRRASDDRAVQP
mmetsp:Transcript_16121/g.27254  ORF Transcript_16121/g.27254 Transcript_16121/m.27254 type:complete len:291 (+) Transcript_16121:295-1167(+)